MKKVKGVIAVILMSAASLFAQDQNVAQNNDNMNNMNMSDDCSQLSDDEQNFAGQLSDMNAMAFCSKMSSMQRQKAMQMSTMKGGNMSPDDAVQKVMQGNMSKQPSRNSGGACPVK